MKMKMHVLAVETPGYGLYNDRGKTPPYLPQMIVRNAAFQSRTGAQKQTRGAGPQLLLHLPSLGTPTPTPPFPVPSNMTQTQIQIQVQRQIHIQIQIQTANYQHISLLPCSQQPDAQHRQPFVNVVTISTHHPPSTPSTPFTNYFQFDIACGPQRQTKTIEY